MTSTSGLQAVLTDLTAAARQRGLSDSAWARAAGLPKESLSRLRRRADCDWATLERLAAAADQRFVAVPRQELTPDGHFPLTLLRDDEEHLYQLVLSGDLSAVRWRSHGPSFFMAGLAVLVAGSPDFPRRALLELADSLHPGILEISVYSRWLQRTPIEPSRFFAQLRAAAA